jgi:4-diphosphocytidyl-2-C-methyl-D-erythritol kinase
LKARAKLNLCLALGPRRDDGLHELRSLFVPLELADRIAVEPAERDEVLCPGVEGPNLAERALAELRGAGWERPPLRISIDKRVPVAAGLGGGSADAAAVLRLAREQLGEGRLSEIAARLGADVPSQLDPRPTLVGGAGERLEPLAVVAGLGAVLIPDPTGLSTAAVYAEADRLGIGREPAELGRIAAELRRALGAGTSPLAHPELLFNDLAAAALSLRPSIAAALEALADAGAEATLISGSGPTAVGLFADIAKADAAAEGLAPGWAGALVTATWGGD